MSKPKILYFAMGEYDSTSLYRMCGVLPYLPISDYELINGSKITDWNWSVFVDIKLFIFQRPCFDLHVNIIMLAKAMGVKVIVDYDDNLLAVDVYNPTYQFYEANKVNVMKCISKADEVWVTTQSLKDAYKKWNNNIYIIPNAHNDYIFPVEKKKHFNPNTKHVLWRGSNSHMADVMEVADDLVKVINENTDWTFNFWGERFVYMEQRCGDNYICHTQMDTVSYFESLHEYNPNIMIFPLCDTVFNRSKSNICWIEATYAGAAFFGNKNLPSFDIIPMYYFHDQILKTDTVSLKISNELSWDYITENLLLSNINKQRHERLIANL